MGHLFSLEGPLETQDAQMHLFYFLLTATMGLFSFPPTLSTAHDPRGKKQELLLHLKKK